MTTNFYIPEDNAPLPPKGAEIITTACDYCIVGCGYNVYRWPLEAGNGGVKAHQNAFGIDFPSAALIRMVILVCVAACWPKNLTTQKPVPVTV